MFCSRVLTAVFKSALFASASENILFSPYLSAHTLKISIFLQAIPAIASPNHIASQDGVCTVTLFSLFLISIANADSHFCIGEATF